MEKVAHKKLSYKIIGLLFKTHKELGRFRNEKQYADYFEKLLIQGGGLNMFENIGLKIINMDKGKLDACAIL